MTWEMRVRGALRVRFFLCSMATALGLIGCAQRPVFFDDFHADPAASGWSAQATWVAETSPHMVVRGGTARSGAIAVQGGRFYRLTFTVDTRDTGYWALHFRDAAGDDLPDVYGSITASPQMQHIETCVRAHALAASAEMYFVAHEQGELAIDDVSLTPVRRDAVRAWADALYAALPRVQSELSPDRWHLIPRTMAKLRRGERVKIVIVGDSIANDIANSAFDVLIERQYPGARIDLISVVANNAGAWYYVKDDRVGRLVHPHAADLIIFSGISSANFVSYQMVDLVRQFRAAGSAELLFSLDMPANGESEATERIRRYARVISADAPGMAGELFRFAAEQHLAVINTAGPVGDAVAASGCEPSYFMRDVVHYNDRGRQLLAHALEAWFAPTGDELSP